MPKPEDSALFVKLTALIDPPAKPKQADDEPTAVTLPSIREHAQTLHLLLHVWLQCDSSLDSGAAEAVRRFAAARTLSDALQRVQSRDRATTPANPASALACGCACSVLSCSLVPRSMSQTYETVHLFTGMFFPHMQFLD